MKLVMSVATMVGRIRWKFAQNTQESKCTLRFLGFTNNTEKLTRNTGKPNNRIASRLHGMLRSRRWRSQTRRHADGRAYSFSQVHHVELRKASINVEHQRLQFSLTTWLAWILSSNQRKWAEAIHDDLSETVDNVYQISRGGAIARNSW